MGVAQGDARDPEVIEHLLSALAPDARLAWDEASSEPRSTQARDRGLHDRVHAQLGAVGRLLRSSRHGIPVHAACCTLRDGRGVLIAGPTGSGKSTLALVLGMHLGATIVSDDTVWVSEGRASSIGAPVALRRGGPGWDAAQALWYASDTDRLLVQPADLGIGSTRSADVDLLLYPRYGEHRPDLVEVGPGESFCNLAASLLRECTVAELDELAALVARLPAAVVRYPDVDSSIELCQQLLDRRANPHPVQPARLDAAAIERAGLCRDVQGIRFGNEVVIWRPPEARLLCVRNWPEGTLWETPAAGTLQANGFLERKES